MRSIPLNYGSCGIDLERGETTKQGMVDAGSTVILRQNGLQVPPAAEASGAGRNRCDFAPEVKI